MIQQKEKVEYCQDAQIDDTINHDEDLADKNEELKDQINDGIKEDSAKLNVSNKNR
jgi:hypothetical protein